jgi:hypothetical protein
MPRGDEAEMPGVEVVAQLRGVRRLAGEQPLDLLDTAALDGSVAPIYLLCICLGNGNQDPVEQKPLRPQCLPHRLRGRIAGLPQQVVAEQGMTSDVAAKHRAQGHAVSGREVRLSGKLSRNGGRPLRPAFENRDRLPYGGVNCLLEPTHVLGIGNRRRISHRRCTGQ